MSRDFPRSPGRTQKPISLGEPFVCTSEHPWTPDVEAPLILHPDAIEGEQHDGWPSGDYVDMRCPHCGHEWEKELPQ